MAGDDHQFKPGDKILAEFEVVAITRDGGLLLESDSVCAECEDPYCSSDLVVQPWDLNKLLPAPREGEYRLTVEELASLVDEANSYVADKIRAGKGVCGDYPTWRDEGIKQWLSNRKEEA